MQPVSLGEGLKQVLTPVTIPLQYTVLATVGSLATGPALLAPLLMGVHHMAPATAGVVSGLALVGGAIGSFFLPTIAFRSGKLRTYTLLYAVLAPIFFILQFIWPVSASSAMLLAIPSFLFGFFAAPVMGIAMGVGQMQPSVTPMNAGLLAGVFLTSIGIGAALISQIVSRVVDLSGGSYAAGAWVETALMALSLVAVWVAVKER